MIFINEYELFEGKIDYRVSEDDDEPRWTITAYDGDRFLGEVIFDRLDDAYWYFEDDFTEDEYLAMFPDDELMRIEHLRVMPESQGERIGTELMNRAMDMIRKSGVRKAYLNASPMLGYRGGLPLSALVKFYEKFGFEKMLEQGKNTQMIMDLTRK